MEKLDSALCQWIVLYIHYFNFLIFMHFIGTSFCCIFFAWFFYKNVLYLILNLWTRFQCHTFFSFSRYQTKCVIEILFTQLMTSWTLDLSSIILQSNGRQVEKEWRTEIQKFEYLKNKKSFLHEIKSIFYSFGRAIIWWKNRKLMKIVDRSFKKIVHVLLCIPN